MQSLDRYTALRRRLLNLVQSALLLGGMAVLAGALGWILFGAEGVVWAAGAAALTIAFAPSFSPRWVLHLTGAREIVPRQAPELHRLLELVPAYAGRGLTTRWPAAQEALYEMPVIARPPRWHWNGLWY